MGRVVRFGWVLALGLVACGSDLGIAGDRYACETDGDCTDGCKCAPVANKSFHGICDCGTQCIPKCDGKVCGDDGCGGVCGTCATGASCRSGACVKVCDSECGDVATFPAATLSMGCDGAGCDASEQPQHAVTVAAFAILKTEVTVKNFERCLYAGACTTPLSDGEHCNWKKSGRDLHPVNCLSWSQATQYCGWANARLCTEAEWELAARGTEGRAYPWGPDAPTCELVVMDDGSGQGCGKGGTAPVASKNKGATSAGVMDLAGNVWEWVQDVYHATYVGAPTDGTAWVDGDASRRVLRGGGYADPAAAMSATRRIAGDPSLQLSNQGIRCCRDVP